MTGPAPNTDGSIVLLERERELGVLDAVLRRAQSGSGSLVAIAGAAGMGKSALLGAGASRARELGLLVRAGRGSELEQELSFGIVRQLFEPPLRSAPRDVRDRLLSGAAAGAARLFDDVPLDGMAGTDGGFATLHGLHWLAAGFSAQRPLLLAVDDAHWADAPSLRALNYLAARIAELPIVLAVTMRPHEPTPVPDLLEALESHPDAERIEAAALHPDTTARLVRETFPAAADDVCVAFHQSSAGNPFYLRELLRSLGPVDVGSLSPAAVRQTAVTSVSDRVLRRIRGLGPGAVELAAAMSVLGASGRMAHAAAVGDVDPEVAAGLARLMRRVEILADDDPFEWIHPLVQRSIYDGLSAVERDRLHGRAAHLLAAGAADPGIVAAHLASLRATGSAEVVAGLLTAAEDALARDAPEVAVDLVRRALEEGAAEPGRFTLLLRLGRVELSRRNPEALGALRQAREAASDPSQRALAVLGLGEALVNFGEWEEAATITAEALQERAALAPELALELELARALVCAFDPPLAPEFWRDRDRLRELAGGESWPARALAAALAMVTSFRGEPAAAVVELCQHALAGDVLIGERGAGAFAPAHVLAALTTVEAYEPALEFVHQLAAAAQTQGSIANAVVAEGYRGAIDVRRGDLAAGEERLLPIAELAADNGMLLIEVNTLWWLIDVIMERASYEKLAAMVEAVRLPPVFADAAGGAWTLSVRGRARALRGARTEAEADLRAAVGIYRRLGFGPAHDSARSALALLLSPADRDEALSLVEEELGLARETRPLGVALRANGLLLGGDSGVELLRESAAILDGSPARYEHAQSLVELGAALRRGGRRSQAREPLAAGMELAFACGAERLVTRAREELVAAGARPRRFARSGFAGLTASERRIVRLAAEGRSNPEIAQALYLSVKTVETHLSHAYAKLDLSGPGSRGRLAALVT